jgi:hypothetical protein
MLQDALPLLTVTTITVQVPPVLFPMLTEQRSLLWELTEQDDLPAASALHVALLPVPVRPCTEQPLPLRPPVGFCCDAEQVSLSLLLPGPPPTPPVLQDEPPPSVAVH